MPRKTNEKLQSLSIRDRGKIKLRAQILSQTPKTFTHTHARTYGGKQTIPTHFERKFSGLRRQPQQHQKSSQSSRRLPPCHPLIPYIRLLIYAFLLKSTSISQTQKVAGAGQTRAVLRTRASVSRPWTSPNPQSQAQ